MPIQKYLSIPLFSEISGLEFIEPYPALVSGDMGGNYIIWSLSPQPRPHRQIYSFVNPSTKFEGSSCAIASIGWVQDADAVIGGDAEGIIKVWDIKKALMDRGLQKLSLIRLGSQQFRETHFLGLGGNANGDSGSGSGSCTADSESCASADDDCSSESSGSGKWGGSASENSRSSNSGSSDNSRNSNSNSFSHGGIEPDSDVKMKARGTFLTSTNSVEVQRDEKEEKKNEKPKKKADATLVRYWEAHKEQIEDIHIVSSNFLSYKRFSHKSR